VQYSDLHQLEEASCTREVHNPLGVGVQGFAVLMARAVVGVMVG
jgi:hypothetical protein